MKEPLFIECVAERDIDLLLLEEIHASAFFRKWLYEAVVGASDEMVEFIGAYHSISHTSLGESDLVAKFKIKENMFLAILVENKIDAQPQPEQALRYRLRGQAGIEDGLWQQYRTCMIAPLDYLNRTRDAGGYQHRISYEAIRDWFLQTEPSDPRVAYKARLIQAAIDQERRGYQPIPHAEVTQFWSDYWSLVQAEFPHLKMNKPGIVPAGSDWPEFRNSELGRERIIKHKLGAGAVDLQIEGAGDHVDELSNQNPGLFNDGIEVISPYFSPSLLIGVGGGGVSGGSSSLTTQWQPTPPRTLLRTLRTRLNAPTPWPTDDGSARRTRSARGEPFRHSFSPTGLHYPVALGRGLVPADARRSRFDQTCANTVRHG